MADIREAEKTNGLKPQSSESVPAWLPTPEWDYYYHTNRKGVKTRQHRIAIVEREDEAKTSFDFQFNLDSIDPGKIEHVLFASAQLAYFSLLISAGKGGDLLRLGPPLDKDKLRTEKDDLRLKREIPLRASGGIGVYIDVSKYQPTPNVSAYIDDLRSNLSALSNPHMGEAFLGVVSQFPETK